MRLRGWWLACISTETEELRESGYVYQLYQGRRARGAVYY